MPSSPSGSPPARLPGAVLALDVGTRTIGVAYTDPSRTFVFTGATLTRRGVEKDALVVAGVVSRQRITQVLVGLPLAPEGVPGGSGAGAPVDAEPRGVRLARQVGEAVARLTGLPVAWVDESYTTTEANERLRLAGADNRAVRRVIDGHAASVFLEDWLRAESGPGPART